MPRYNKFFGVLEGRADAHVPSQPIPGQEAIVHRQQSSVATTNESPRGGDKDGDGQPQFQLFDQIRLPAYLRHLEKNPQSYVMGFDEFDAGHDWNSDAFPLALCEFLAYKSALAYERPARIEQNLLREHPRGISNFRFFDSRNRYGHTQAYGFVLSRTAYIVFRGTEFLTWADWATDFDTRLTTKLDPQRYEDRKAMDRRAGTGPSHRFCHRLGACAGGRVRVDRSTPRKPRCGAHRLVRSFARRRARQARRV